VEAGTGEAMLEGVHAEFNAGFAILVPVGKNHNI
jgi:hypothetical protein